MAVSPMDTNSERVTTALRLKPEKKTALPSRRVSTQPSSLAPTVPSKKSAPERPTAQSPPLGVPCGPMKLGPESAKVMPAKPTSTTGAACVPVALMSTDMTGTSTVVAAGAEPLNHTKSVLVAGA